jgi:hypothetical protein
MPDTVRKDKKTLWIGLAVTVLLALMTLPAYGHSGAGRGDLIFALVLPPVIGAFTALFLYRRFYAWLACYGAGLFIGALSSLPLLTGEMFTGEFFVVMVTLVFFAVLGFIVGAAAEFIRLLHFIIHGGRVLDYPDRVRKDTAPPPPPL